MLFLLSTIVFSCRVHNQNVSNIEIVHLWLVVFLVAQILNLKKEIIIQAVTRQCYEKYSEINPGPGVIKLFLYSTQLNMKFQLLIKTKIPTNEEVSCF